MAKPKRKRRRRSPKSRPPDPRRSFEQYADAVVYVAVENPDGTPAIGSAFHVGHGVYVTARHVVDGVKITEVGSAFNLDVSVWEPDPANPERLPGRAINRMRQKIVTKGPFFHPDPRMDVAVFEMDGIKGPAVPLGGHLDDWIDSRGLILAPVTVMGYPPIPLSGPVLVTTRAEVNAIVDPITGGGPLFLLSCMARGGFSGGLAHCDWGDGGFALGVVSRSLLMNNKAEELGYFAVLTIEPILVCLEKAGLLRASMVEHLPGLFETVDGPPAFKLDPSQADEVVTDEAGKVISMRFHGRPKRAK